MVTNLGQLCGTWREVVIDFMALADLNPSSLAALLGVDESTVRGWLRGSAPKWDWVLANWHRFPKPLRELVVRPLLANDFVLTPAGDIAKATEPVFKLGFTILSEANNAIRRAIEHDQDNVWTAAELATTGRDFDGIKRRLDSTYLSVADRAAGFIKRQLAWRR